MTVQNSLRALVVEDDAAWQQIIGEILLDCGMEVDFASSPEEASIALKSQPHRVAVVDLSLSPNDHNNVDGLRVLETVRRLDPNCRPILLTGFATVELAVAALTDYGAFTFLRKENFQRSQFKEIVHRILISPPNQVDAQNSPVISTVPEPPSKGQTSEPKLPAERALVVDDDAGWRSILEELLLDAGYSVRTCASFGDALGVLRREKIAIAVIDLSLQGSGSIFGEINDSEINLDGYQLLKTAKANGIPAIVVSGMTESAEIQRVYADYAVAAYIEKHAFDRALFRRAVEESRKSHASMSKLSALTEREREVLDLLAQGLTNKEIAENLVITTNTVKRHLKSVFEKLDVHTRSAATALVTGK